MRDLICAGCEKKPSQINEYIMMGRIIGEHPDDFVWSEEGTLNRNSGKFLCSECWIAAGMPSSPGGWKVPD